MTGANDPSASALPQEAPSTSESRTSIQAVPPAPAGSTVISQPAPVKPRRKRLTPEKLATEVTRLDAVLVGVVLLLVFFLASFAARNSDFWMHLASGRLISQGQFPFQEDPFSFAAEKSWVNHSWLWDLLLYGVFRIAGGGDGSSSDLTTAGAVLVGIKAFFVAILAGVMLLIRRPGSRVWLSAIFAALTALTMSRWLLLQPKIISFLFLGLTIYLLNRESTGLAARGPRWLRPMIAIPVLFALWVNLDEWFVLGPFAVALYLIGELLQQVIAPIRTGDDAPAPGLLGRLGLLFVVSLAACLVSPYHIRAFQVPSDLAPWLSGDSPLQSDDGFQTLFQAPFSSDYLGAVFKNLNSAGIAYYLLAGLGVVSFVLNIRGWRAWRMMVWLGFFLPSFFLARTIPFFAVVAGPIAALNFQDYAAQRFGLALRVENPWKTWSLAGRFLTLGAGIALLLLAWPGMLNSQYDDPLQSHHVAWRLEAEPSYRQAAVKLAELRLNPVMAAGNGFNFSPEMANYCAWFCPTERSFMDLRFDLFPGRAGDFVELRQALFLRPERFGQDRAAVQREWNRRLSTTFQKQFSQLKINHVVVSGPSFQSIKPVTDILWRDTRHWTVLYIDGRTAIFGWKGLDARAGEDPFQTLAFEPDALAFGPAVPLEARAPSQGPEVPQPPNFLERYWFGPALRPLDTDASAMYQSYAQAISEAGPVYAAARQAAWQIMSMAAPVSAAHTGAFPGLACVCERTSQIFVQSYLTRDPRVGPAAAAVLALRAARRAVAANPTDYNGYVELVRASQYLSESQELPWGSYGTLQQIRHIQRLAGLQNVLTLKPEAAEVHGELATLFTNMNYFDLAVEHWDKFLESSEASGPRPRESTDDFKKRIDNFKLMVKDREDRIGLQRKRNEYELAKRTQTTLARKAGLAVQKGLVKEALDLLQNEDDPTVLGSPDVLRLAMSLLINTGQLRQAKELAKELGDPVFNYLIAAGLGDYVQAQENLEKIVDRGQKGDLQQMLSILRDQAFSAGPESFFFLARGAAQAGNWADFRVCQGVLALEQGDIKSATDYFHKAFKVGETPASQVLVTGAFAPGLALNAANFLQANFLVPQNSFNFSTQDVAGHYSRLIQLAAQKKK